MEERVVLDMCTSEAEHKKDLLRITFRKQDAGVKQTGKLEFFFNYINFNEHCFNILLF